MITAEMLKKNEGAWYEALNEWLMNHQFTDSFGCTVTPDATQLMDFAATAAAAAVNEALKSTNDDAEENEQLRQLVAALKKLAGVHSLKSQIEILAWLGANPTSVASDVQRLREKVNKAVSDLAQGEEDGDDNR